MPIICKTLSEMVRLYNSYLLTEAQLLRAVPYVLQKP